MLKFLPIMLAAVLKILAYYAQYYAQEQDFCSAYYTNYIQVSMNKSLFIRIIDNFRNTVILKCIINLSNVLHLMTVLLEYIDRLLQLVISVETLL